MQKKFRNVNAAIPLYFESGCSQNTPHKKHKLGKNPKKRFVSKI